MLILYRNLTDPYLNIAAEEYFIKHATEDLCMIWQNEPSVIIGKHQNAFAEINYPYIRANQIPVIRRISGGGAVYHDKGNVNFSFIKKTDKLNPVDFTHFTSIIIKFIESFDLEVNVNRRNSLFIDNLKFSGHAEHVFHDRVLHHGTILFNTNLEALHHCLSPKTEYPGKAMASVRSEVGNIAPLLPKNIDINQFINSFLMWLKEYYPQSSTSKLHKDDLRAIYELSELKYKTWQWNFGYSPAYSFQTDIQTYTENISVVIRVENGKIVKIELPSDTISQWLSNILISMTGLLHKEEEIDKFVENNRPVFELAGVNIVNFTKSLFR